MKNTELVAKVLDVAKNHNTLYVMGCFGAPGMHIKFISFAKTGDILKASRQGQPYRHHHQCRQNQTRRQIMQPSFQHGAPPFRQLKLFMACWQPF